MMKRMICIFLCLLLLLSGCGTGASGQEPSETAPSAAPTSPGGQQTSEPPAFNTEMPAGTRQGAVSLNGQWELYADTLEKSAEYKADDGTGDLRAPLAGCTYGMVLDVKTLDESDYVKAKAWLDFDVDAAPVPGEGGLWVFLRANGGQWIGTRIDGYANGQAHWVDLRIRRDDLTVGENKIEISGNAAAGVYLLGNKAADAAGYTLSEDAETPSGVDYALRLRAVTCGSNWNPVTVPSAAEGQFSVGYANRVYPETYNGILWYRRSFSFEEATEVAWWLCFDAVDYKADVWLNGAYLGGHEGGYTGFSFCVTEELLQDGNTLVVRVVDQDWNNGLTEDDIHIKETLAGFTQDTRELNYSGIWQSVYLEPRGTVAIDDLYVLTKDHDKGELEIWARLYNPGDSAVRTELKLTVVETGQTVSETVDALPGGVTEVVVPVTVENPSLWSPSSPVCYTLKAEALAGETADCVEQPFGIYTIRTEGNKIVHNGSPIFLTGMLHWGSYYDNYTSAVAPEQVAYEITQLKNAGFNAIKYCLFSPPDYVLDLCDQMGMYVYIEYPIWNVNETAAFFERAYLQMMEMVEKDRRHPCVIMSDFNCEDLEFTPEMDALMAWCVDTAKSVDPSRLFTDNSSNGVHRYGEFATCHPYYQARIFEDMLDGWIERRGNQPLILGEYADISVLRDLQALNAQTTEQYSWYHDYYGDVDQGQILRELGYDQTQVDMVIAQSVGNAQELKKYYIEASKAHSNVAGLFLTHIFESPNGWADGWFDDLYQPHFDPETMQMAAGETALLLNQASVNYWAGQSYEFHPAVSLYGGQNLEDGELRFTLWDADTPELEQTAVAGIALENGDYYTLPTFTISFPETAEAVRYSLELTLYQGGTEIARNAWSVWAYPKDTLTGTPLSERNVQVYDPANRLGMGKYSWMSGLGSGADLIVTTQLNGTVLNYLSAGGTVIYVGSQTDLTQTEDNWDYNRFSFAFLPDPEDSLAASLKNSGYGGLQFADLATATHLIPRDGSVNIIGRFGITDGSVCSFLCEYPVGNGTLLQTTLRLDNTPLQLGGDLLTHESLNVKEGENVLGAYLLEQMIRYELEK